MIEEDGGYELRAHLFWNQTCELVVINTSGLRGVNLGVKVRELTCTPLGVMSSCLARFARMTPFGFLSWAKVCSRTSSWAWVVLLRCFISLGI